jgi:hypothetical protein
VVNRSDKSFDGWVALPTAPGTSWLFFDPMTGNITVPATRNDVNGNISIRIALDPHASIIIREVKETKATAHKYDDPQAVTIPLNGQWNIRFTEGGPELPQDQSMEGPRYWTSLEGSALSNFSGKAVYLTRFKLNEASKMRWTLDLGKLSATASVRINGKDLGSLVGPTFKLDIPANLLRAENELEVTVSSLMANRIADMDRKGIPWKIFYNINISARRKENLKNGVFDAGGWSPLPSGLAGPVVLKGHSIPVKK